MPRSSRDEMSLWGEALRSPARGGVVPAPAERAAGGGRDDDYMYAESVVPESLDIQELRQRGSPRRNGFDASVAPQTTPHKLFSSDAERTSGDTHMRGVAVNSPGNSPENNLDVVSRDRIHDGMDGRRASVSDQEAAGYAPFSDPSNPERGAPVPESQDLEELRERSMRGQAASQGTAGASDSRRAQQREENEAQRAAAIQALASAGWPIGKMPSSLENDDFSTRSPLQTRAAGGTQLFPPLDSEQSSLGRVLSTALQWAAVALVSVIAVGVVATVTISVGAGRMTTLGEMAAGVPPSLASLSGQGLPAPGGLGMDQLVKYEQTLPLACQHGAAMFREGETQPRIADDEIVVACYCSRQLQPTNEQLPISGDSQAGVARVAETFTQSTEVHSVVVPEGLIPGQTLSFRVPDGRGPFSVLVPEGSVAGQTLRVTVPKDSPSPPPQLLSSVAPANHYACYVLTNYGRQGRIQQAERTQLDAERVGVEDNPAESLLIEVGGKPVHPPLTAEYIELAQLVGSAADGAAGAAASRTAKQEGGANAADASTVDHRASGGGGATQQVSWWERLVELHRKFHPLDAHSLRVELRKMRLSAIKKRAIAIGVSLEALERADDTDDIKHAVIELVIRHSA